MGLFCNIDITKTDIGMFLIDFVGFERPLTSRELKQNGCSNKYLLHVRHGFVFDCKDKAEQNICLASRCNEVKGLGDILSHLNIVFCAGRAPHFKILRAAQAHTELFTMYRGNV